MKSEKYVLRLYPRAWRERYEEEVLAMLEERPTSLLDNIDLFFGALDAHLHPHLGTTGMPLYERIKLMLSHLRRSLLLIFCAYSGFALAGLAFQKLTEYDDFMNAAHTNTIVGLSFDLVIIGAVVALLAVLTGSLPIAAAIIRSALARRRYGPLLLLAVPILAFAIFLGATLFLEALHRPDTHSSLLAQIFRSKGIFLGTLIAGTIVSAGALCLAVERSEISAKLLHFAFLPSVLATISMVLMLGATIVWGLGLRDGAPQLFAGNDGIVGSSTTGTWLGIVIAMAIMTTLATVSLMRGLSARSALNTATL